MDNKTERRKEQLLRMSGVNPLKCMRCGKCSATCPSYDEMEYHPHEFVYMVEKGDLEPLMRSSSIYKCLSCFACVDRCPRGVEPAKLVEAIRVMVVREKDGNHLTPDAIPALLDDDMPQQALMSALRKYAK
ncbi:MAG: 4Fe-4S dicluster domain-containing protein [Candidatus Faecousia sp.]|uniref:4Fe-4S dicluster domain-containing protein n=1 Tax=Faecousia sp. TaxID=2952921 RepID=UPI002A9079D3|nr:4Fe-4S dicluster domain-containing protein [Candidatus Faecousia sp.]